jgi:hypothetical protein
MLVIGIVLGGLAGAVFGSSLAAIAAGALAGAVLAGALLWRGMRRN